MPVSISPAAIIPINVKTEIRAAFYAQENEILFDGVTRNDWIVNPYKSQSVDNLCLPANIFNYKKERQIKCMYYDCLEEASSQGLSLEMCKSKLELDTCLYLEGAEVKTSGKGFFDHVWERLPTIALNSGVQIGTAIVWKKLCGDYLRKFGLGMKLGKDMDFGGLSTTGMRDVLCGIGGAFMRIQELRDIFDNKFSAFKPSASAPRDLPLDWPDACTGIDYGGES